MINPGNTYRIQFHKEFTFTDFRKTLPYLVKLGVKSIYASPIFEAVKGSVHGYDITNPLKINSEIGTEEELRELKEELNKNNMYWIQDIVPNHMAFDPSNDWLMDVLEKGEHSEYSKFFDINWNSKHDPGRLMVPFLGKPLDDVIENNEIKLAIKERKLVLLYFDAAYPVNFKTYLRIFKELLQGKAEIKTIEQQVSSDATKKEELYSLLFTTLKQSEKTIQETIIKTNQDRHTIKTIADEQYYRLCHYQETDYRINYRRFFTVNGLICLNIQENDVFSKHHELVIKLTKEGVFDGLRIDHIDGLFDPTEYLQRLRKTIGENIYIIVEKILGPEEQLPSKWPIQGNTGYDFLSIVNNLFTNKEVEKNFSSFYHKITHDRKPFEQHIHDKKSLILHHQMGGELQNLYQLFLDLQLGQRKQLSAVHPDDLKYTIGEFLIECPVYRYYGTKVPFSNHEAQALRGILNKIRRTTDSPISVDILEYSLLIKPEESNTEYNQKVEFFYRRCMQVSGPLMAKGVEDTLMYTYNQFIAHNEVGDSPASFGISIQEFNEMMIQRQQQWPLSLNATSTHDTKRGEDARSRLNILTDFYEEWFHLVEKWNKLNASLKKNNIPDANHEYLIYQVLIASHPMPGDEDPAFANRLDSYLEKALREAKTHSNWTNPNYDYENGVKEFAKKLLDKQGEFWHSFEPFFTKVARAAILNSLSQVILKFTCPGIPDVYQGCELWDFSFVDPDNRRPVDFKKRKEYQDSLENQKLDEISTLLSSGTNGKVKQYLVSNLFKLRSNNEKLFTTGEYEPLAVEGKNKDNFLAFARKDDHNILIVVLPKFFGSMPSIDEEIKYNWEDMAIRLPKHVTGILTNIFTDDEIKSSKQLKLQNILRQLPFAILKGEMSPTNTRGAGILLHISSLPSAFGIGDMGPECYRFIDYLRNNKQKFWQLLPLNPTESGQGHSPYSAISSRAGNSLFISPEILVTEGLLEMTDVDKLRIVPTSQVDFNAAEKIREGLLEVAFVKFNTISDNSYESFEHFCMEQAEWLEDFAYYTLLKQLNNNNPWYEWPDEFKWKEKNALDQLSKEYDEELKKIKWIQYIFNRQWIEVKKYSNKNKVKLIGDLPFYISYDSADVWAHKEIFEINEQGKIITVAGVPPDAFSSQGQLWGMPIFKWDVLKSSNYKWWIDRIRRNRELFDLIRIDHFRAFADYWAIPAGEQSAINGAWVDGPGADFFNSVRDQLRELPFIAEDLGEINDKVFELRDSFMIPGMKVLQFAFGEDMPTSDYIPHNYTENFLVYTGTHDNNTTKGWYTKNADQNTKKRIQQYLGSVTDDNIHEVLSRLAYSSTARICILPLQDVLGLGDEARMNKPASTENNWTWRVLPGQLNHSNRNHLLEWVWLFNR